MPVHVFFLVFLFVVAFFVCLICVCVCVCVFGGLQNPLLSHSRKDVSQRRGGDREVCLNWDLNHAIFYTVESINNDNCNNENTVVMRHFSIPVFYPS